MEKRIDLVFVPTPGMGHLLSAVNFAKIIIQRDHRISVVILIINFNLNRDPFNVVNAYVDSQSQDADSTGRLTFVTLPPLSNPPDPSSSNFFTDVVDLHKPLVKQAVLDRVESGLSPTPAGFILDIFCTAMIDVANELHVPSYIFFTSGASLLSLMFHLQSLADDEGVDVAEELSEPEREYEFPGFKTPLPGKVIPGVFLDKKEGRWQMILRHARRFRETKGILINTYMELDSHLFQPLLEQVEKHKIPPVYPVGPILELDNKSRNGSHEEEHESIMKWLNQQPSSSVVFLCFGSMGSFDAEQVKEIADGLERAGHRFLWSLRIPPPEGKFGMPSQNESFLEALPEGFLERTSHLGKVIAWAPQVAVLGHRAIGGFVSHCGWNSTLQSLWFGVPMATWPLYAEQQLNAFELVKELGVAVEIRMDYRRDWRTRKANFVVTAEEIENGVRKLMSMEEETRKKVREIGEKGRSALQEGGSSHQFVGRFIGDVLNNVA